MSSKTYDVCIIGSGISGLSVAAFLKNQQAALQIKILEKEAEPGGAIRSFSDNGYLAEWGPHGFLDNCKESRSLISLAGMEKEITTAPLKEFVRYVCLDQTLRCIPQKPLQILKEPLIPFSAKLRVLADIWKQPLDGEPSVAQWVEYRFGKALLPFADAVFTGTYAGDFSQLKIDAVMAGVRELEKKKGSVIRGVLGKLRASSSQKPKKKRELPAMTSFAGGMASLPQRLAERYCQDGSLLYQHNASKIKRQGETWLVETDQGEYRCTHLVLAIPINQSLALLDNIADTTPPPLQKIPEARIATVLLGFDNSAQIPFGFGYLAPEQEQRFTLGALFSSHMFPGRAPKGHQLIEALVGGRRHPDRLEIDDDSLVNAVYNDLRQLMPLPTAPCYTKILRPRVGIPQFEAGYTSLLAWRDELHQHRNNLHICGFGWKGIGINDMTKEAWKMSERIITTQPVQETTEIKGVYF